jgi:hypothetical protein
MVLQKEHGSESTCYRRWSKKLLEDFPNIIVENHLEYDPNIIEKIMYFVTKAPGN